MANRKRHHPLILLFIFIISFCEGTEVRPWLGNLYEFEWKNSLHFQTYQKVETDSHSKKYSSSDFFLDTSLSNSIRYNLSLEAEVEAARTRKQMWDIDHLRFNARYQWLDDIAIDEISLVTGLSFIQAFQSSLKDISSFHHGKREFEFFVSIGKEFAEGPIWRSRVWGDVRFGLAERDSPWIRGDVSYEYRIGCFHELQVKLDVLCGLGNRSLKVHHFHGYGPVRHRSVDISFRYLYIIEFVGNISLDYSYRLYALNYPSQAHQVELSFLYPFGF